ncbi:MAG: DUF1194 domain-containing protein [Gemmobacter sp.]
MRPLAWSQMRDAAAALCQDAPDGRWPRPNRCPMRCLPLALALLLILAPPARACRLALALAMDVSLSVDDRDYAIQQQGLIAALQDAEVRAAFLRGDPVALAVYEWSGIAHQQVVQDWVMVTGPQVLDRIAARLAAHRRPSFGLATALGTALDFGRKLLERAPACGAQVIDVSGDGRNNQGPDPRQVYAQGGWDGIIVNALVISAHEMSLEAYMRREVIRGPGAFVEHAPQHSDFPPAIRRKLIRELTEAVFGGLGPLPTPHRHP